MKKYIKSASNMSQLSTYLNFDEAKNKILKMLNNGTTKSVSIVPLGADAASKDILELAQLLKGDQDIADALESAGVIGHLDLGHNRYAQGPISLKFRITMSKRGKSGWSNW